MKPGRWGKGGLAPWPSLPGALVAAVVGQVLLLAGQVVAGSALYGIAAFLLAAGQVEEEILAPPAELSARQTAAALLVILAAAFLLRRVAIDSIPWGLNNDEGIEGLIACRFLDGERITPFSSIGLSRETLYHLLLVPLFALLGPGMAALRLLSLLCALATLAVLFLAGRELFGTRAALLSAALLAVSPWHLLYSRTGFRNILLPLFLLGVLGAFHRALAGRRPGWFAATGVLLGIGMYSYTSFRVVPPILLAWVVLRRFLFRRPPLTWKEAGGVVVPFLFLMIPQVPYALRSPGDFLSRGGYVLSQTPRASLPANVLYSLLMPMVYPARYGVMQSLYYFGDGVSLVYAAVKRTPETAVSAAVMACGILLLLARLRRRRSEEEAVVLLWFGVTVGTVGLAGPSLTRLIGNLPLLCLAGGVFLEETGRAIGRRFTPVAGRATVALCLAAAGALCVEQYFLCAGRSSKAMFYYAAPQTLMGLYASSRASDHPVYVLYSEEPETLQFLTYSHRRWVRLERDPSRLDLDAIRSAQLRPEFVVENHPRFAGALRSLEEIFPGAEVRSLTDARRPSEPRVATLLSIPPGPPPPREAPSRGSASPPPGAEASSAPR